VISEVGYDTATEPGSEFVEIFNPTTSTIDLSVVYISDEAEQYFKASESSTIGPPKAPLGGFSSDFIWQFPPGSQIVPGGIVIVTEDSDDFLFDFFGAQLSTFLQTGAQLFECVQDVDSVPDMINWHQQGAGARLSITNAREPIILFTYDGSSDIIQDLDTVVWSQGATFPSNIDQLLIKKTGKGIDGPDLDAIPTNFKADAGTVGGVARSALGAPFGFAPGIAHPNSIHRNTLTETSEVRTNGNGITGHDESTEDWSVSFSSGAHSPGTVHTGIGVPDIDAPASIDFGSVGFTNTAVRTITIRNSGKVAMVVKDLRLTGIAAGDYTIDRTGLPLLVPAGGQVARDATFTANRNFPGSRNVTLFIDTNDPSTPTVQVTFAAFSAEPPIVAVSGPHITDLTLVFPKTIVGRRFTSNVVIANDGETDLTVSSVTILPGPGEFQVDDEFGATIAPNSSILRRVTFAPTEKGDRVAQLVIVSNDPSANTRVVELEGPALLLGRENRVAGSGGGGGGCDYAPAVRPSLALSMAALIVAMLTVRRRRS